MLYSSHKNYKYYLQVACLFSVNNKIRTVVEESGLPKSLYTVTGIWDVLSCSLLCVVAVLGWDQCNNAGKYNEECDFGIHGYFLKKKTKFNISMQQFCSFTFQNIVSVITFLALDVSISCVYKYLVLS